MPRIVPRSRETSIYLLLILFTVAIIGGGYGALIRGDITVAPLLLLVGYVGLAPATIMAWAAQSREPERSTTQPQIGPPPSYGAAALTGLAVLGLYVTTLAPSTAMWDTSEYIAAAYTMGIPHPPGNPLFIIIGRVFALLPIAGSVAARINVLAAICSAVAAGMWFLVAEHVLARWLPTRWTRVVGAVAAALIGATAFTVWNQSVVNEKVYTVSLAGIAVVVWLTFRWLDESDPRRADALLVVVAYLLGLGFANHMAGVLPAPALGVAVLVARPRTLFRVRLVVVAVCAFLFGMTPFATQPIRAAYFPAINEGEPTACRDGLKVSCTFSRGTYDAFMYNFNRKQYAKPDLAKRQAPFSAQLGMWWQYFRWQWLRDAHNDRPVMQSALAALFLVLGLGGAVVHHGRDRRTFWFFGTLMFTMTILLVYYLNFKNGATQPGDPGVDREVRDRDYFYLWSFSAWGVWAGIGLAYIWESFAGIIAAGSPALGRRGWHIAAPVLAIGFIPLACNWSSASRSKDRDSSAFAKDLLNSVEPYSVLVTAGDNDTFPLWYAQEVEGIRRDVVIANTSLLGTDWYARQVVRRPLYAYDDRNGPALFRGKPWIKPTRSPIHMTVAGTDSVPPYVELRGPVTFEAHGIRATIDPKRLEYGVLQRSDIFILRMIADAWPERSIYFSRTIGGYATSIGLEANVITQGLAAKLFIPPKTATRDSVVIAGEGWFDTARTRVLWDSAYGGPAALIAKGDWIDQPSIGIPFLYVRTGAELAAVLRSQGDSGAANRVFDTTRRVASATHLAEFLGDGQRVDAATAARGDTPGVSLGVQRPGDQSTRKPKR